MKMIRRLSPLIALGLFIGALWLLHHQLEQFHLRDIKHALAALPPGRIAAALVFALFSYAALTGYDALSAEYIGQRLPFRRVAFAAFEGFAFSQNIALAGLTGASIRYRLYTGWGLSAAEVASLIVFNAVSFWLGFLTLGGIALIVEPAALPPALDLHPVALRLLGGLLLSVAVTFFAANALRRRSWKLGRWEFRPPTLGVSVRQLVVATLDWSFAAAVLYVLLPPGTISYPSFLGTFLLAQIVALLSHVPGGVGVFETVILSSLASRAPAGALIAALLVFRVAYYLLPLLVAAILLAGSEFLGRDPASRALAARRASSLAPPLLAAAVFLAGAVLLVSGAMSAEVGRLVPLPFVELSHFMGSVVGALLLLLARGLQRRQRGSFWVAVALLSAGIVLTLLKGLGFEEAIFLALVIAVLIPCRSAFYRKASLLDERFTARWAVAIFVVIAGTAWLALFAHKHTQYSASLWWQFALEAHAARSLRAEIGVLLVLVWAAGARLLRPPRLPGGAVAGELDRVRPLVARATSTSACLALLGDKQLLFSASGNCALMHGARGRSWVALGDPIGADDEKSELLWAFRELADRNGCWAAFYEVSSDQSDTWHDLGLGVFKLGEEGRVPLHDFALEGRARRDLRLAHNHGVRAGLSFELIPRDAVVPALPELRRVSDEWLASKNTSEKGFSLGFFDESYLSNFPIAIARKDGRVVGFANVLEAAGLEELSVDLMRHRADAPSGVMDYLFVELMLWGHGAGYRWFNLGMAPFAGLSTGPLAPLSERAGAFLFRHGEHFFNFEGLRSYKSKFDPVWSPRYLACPGGALPFVMADIAALVSGSARGVVARRAQPRRGFIGRPAAHGPSSTV